MKICPVRAKLFCVNGQMDGQTERCSLDRADKANSCFLQFCEPAYKSEAVFLKLCTPVISKHAPIH